MKENGLSENNPNKEVFNADLILIDGIFKKDDVSHVGHIIGAICGTVFGFLYFYTGGKLDIL